MNFGANVGKLIGIGQKANVGKLMVIGQKTGINKYDLKSK